MNRYAAFVRVARALTKVPFVHQGRTRDGLDCAGLVVLAAREVEFEVSDFTAYREVPSPKLVREMLAANASEVDLADARPGDVLLVRSGKLAVHLAILSESGIIHVNRQIGRVVEHRLDDQWRGQIVSAWRLREPV